VIRSPCQIYKENWGYLWNQATSKI